MTDLLFGMVESGVPGVDLFDVIQDVGARGRSDQAFSFGVKPQEFPDAGINGGVLVRASVDPVLSQSGAALAGRTAKMTVTVGYYFKTARDMDGAGKLQLVQGLAPVDLTFDAAGKPSVSQPDFPSALVAAVRSTVDAVVADPPPGSLSQSQDSARRRQEKQKVDSLREKQEVKDSAESDMYGSVEQFVDHADFSEDSTFSRSDLERLVAQMFDSPEERRRRMPELKVELEGYGLKFDPAGGRRSSVTPESVSTQLVRVAEWVGSQSEVSRSELARRLRFLTR